MSFGAHTPLAKHLILIHKLVAERSNFRSPLKFNFFLLLYLPSEEVMWARTAGADIRGGHQLHEVFESAALHVNHAAEAI